MPRITRPTIADVAHHAGVSTATVSRVLNTSGPVEAETAGRVRASIDALNYVPHAAARTLASSRTNTIGLLLPEISGAFFQSMLRGVETAASEAGYDLLVHTTRNPEARAGIPRRTLAEHNTDGLLVFTDSLDTRELRRLFNTSFPTVLMHTTPPKGIQLPAVNIENQSGARKLVDHLIEVHKRDRIVFFQGPEGHEDSAWREKGYRDALKAHDIAFDPSLITRGGFNHDVALQSLEEMLLEGVEFDAIFAGDDDAAVGVLQGLRQAGIRVPEKVAVVGFDDQTFSSTLVPALTTVRAPTEQVGREAVHHLVRVIHGENVEPRLVLATTLVLRESCGCSPFLHK